MPYLDLDESAKACNKTGLMGKHETPRSFLLALRRAIHRCGFTLSSFATTIGVDRSHLTKVLNGRAELSGDKWRKVWHALGCADEFFDAITAAVDGAGRKRRG